MSICIPSFNGERYIQECLDSCINQTYPNIEIVVVDDCSIDGTEKIVQKFASKVRFVRNSRNLGLVANWNRCITAAKGEWIKFIFQDDYMDKECIRKMLQLALYSNARLVLCDRTYLFDYDITRAKAEKYLNQLQKLSSHYRAISVLYPEDIIEIVKGHFLKDNFLGEPIAGLFHRGLVDKYGYFNENLRQICDFEYWLRISLNEEFVFSPEKLVTFRVHHSSTSSLNSKTSASLQDRIVLGGLFLRNDFYESFRSSFANGDLLERYLVVLSSYTKKVGILNMYRFLIKAKMLHYLGTNFFRLLPFHAFYLKKILVAFIQGR